MKKNVKFFHVLHFQLFYNQICAVRADIEKNENAWYYVGLMQNFKINFQIHFHSFVNS